jgi:hypothetical protein
LVGAFVVLGVVNAVALVIREGEHFVWVPPAVAAWYGWVITSVRAGAKASDGGVSPSVSSTMDSRVPVEVAR